MKHDISDEQLRKETARLKQDQPELRKFILTRWWEIATAREVVDFYMSDSRLLCPLKVLFKSFDEVLGRPVFTHELSDRKSLKKEMEGEIEPLTIQDILDKMPQEKIIIISE